MRKKLFMHAAALLLLAGGSVQPLNAQNMENMEKPQKVSPFPVGEKLPEQFSKYFIGQAWLAPLTRESALNVPVSNVTFSPGCRNNWHSHTGGQLLIAVGGRGYYQARGEEARELLPGDIVEIAPDVVHWHGAAPDSWFSHLAVECNPQTNVNTWLEPVDDAQYAAATARDSARTDLALRADARQLLATLFPGESPNFGGEDPELAEIFANFALGEIPTRCELDLRTRLLCTLASAVALDSRTLFRTTLEAALNTGITPAEVKEAIYQTVPYAGMARVADLLALANRTLEERGVVLPLERQGTTTQETCLEKGLEMQRSIFGAETIDAMRAGAPDGQKHIQDFLSGNCFGDFMTRGVLDVPTRELLTFSVLVSLGGCEPQIKGHIAGNVRVGNDKRKLLAVVTHLLPWIGYPRTLNAIGCLNEVLPETRK